MKILPTYVEPRAATVDLAYPEGDPARLRLEIPMGKVLLEPGAGDSIVSGKVTYNVAELKPAYSVKGRTVRIRQKYRFLIPIPGKAINEWEMLLGTAEPYSLEVQVGAAEAKLDLSGLPLTAASLESGAGDLGVTFDAPNPERMRNIQIKTGAGRSVVKGLLNANFEKLKIGGGVGQMVLHFTGDMPAEGGQAKIEGGVGEIVLVLNDDAPIRVKPRVGLGGISVDEELIESGDAYETPGYAGASNKIDIVVSSGLGEIKIEVE